SGSNFSMEGETYVKEKDRPNTRTMSVTPGFFAMLRTPVLSGRAFSTADRADAVPVAVVNSAMVAKFFKGASPIGKRIRLGRQNAAAPWLTIVGVVGNTFTGDPADPM